ncbi:RNA ligase family protein [Streptomyces goshikiensis]
MEALGYGQVWGMVYLPRFEPMLATSGSLPAPAMEHRWAAETKYDGQRVLVYLPGDGTVVLRSRSGVLISAAYPEFQRLAVALAEPAVLDGEIVVLDSQGRSDFARLQPRMGLSGSPVKAARLAREDPAHLVLFDVLFLRGRTLTADPYRERRQLLDGLGLRGPFWSTPVSVAGRCREAFEATRSLGLEGIVCKRLDSAYEPGVRSRSWMKIRHMQSVDVVVGGWVPGQGVLAGLPGAVLVGEPQPDGRLRFLGSVGTGWSDRERRDLYSLLTVAADNECPFVPVPAVAGARWVLPRLVAEVTYATRTRTGLLRHPVWHRLRPDLAPGPW